MVQSAFPEKVWSVFESAVLKYARSHHIHLVPCPSDVHPGSVALSGYHLRFWIVLRLSDAKVWKRSRFCDFPCGHGYSNFLSLPVVRFDMTQLSAVVAMAVLRATRK